MNSISESESTRGIVTVSLLFSLSLSFSSSFIFSSMGFSSLLPPSFVSSGLSPSVCFASASCFCRSSSAAVRSAFQVFDKSLTISCHLVRAPRTLSGSQCGSMARCLPLRLFRDYILLSSMSHHEKIGILRESSE